AADFDNDGDLDLLLINFYSNVVLYRNETNDQNWLRVRAVGKRASRDGIGTKVWLYSEKEPGRLVGFRQIHSGSGYGRCSALETHFGLGKKPAESYRLEVLFPGGKRIVQTGIKPGRIHIVKEPNS